MPFFVRTMKLLRFKILLFSIYFISLLITTNYTIASSDFVTDDQLIVQENSVTVFPTNVVLNQGDEPLVLKVLNYNIQETGVREKWKDVVVAEDADIVILQETGFWSSSLEDEFYDSLEYINSNVPSGPYNYHNMTYEPLLNTGGGTILSRFEITDFQGIKTYYLDDGSEWEINHDILDAEVNIYNISVHVLTIHYPCCDSGIETRPIHNEAVLNYIDSLGDVPVLFTGDFNAISEEDVGLGLDLNLGFETINMIIDPTNPKTTENHTWVDVFRELNPGEPGQTYVNPFYQSRIDYIFANQFFFDKLVNSTVRSDELAQMGSDHYPVLATFNFNTNIDIRPPTKIAGLNGEVINSTSVIVNWAHPPDQDVDYYTVYLDENQVANYTNNDNSHIQSGLTENGIHKFQVTGTDINGNKGSLSAPIYMNTSYGMLTIPQKPIISGNVSSTKITISWSIADDGGFPISSFVVYRSIPSWIDLGRFRVMGEVSDLVFIDDTVAVGKTYYYKIAARNLLGIGIESDVIEFTVPDHPSSNPSSNSDDGGINFYHSIFISTWGILPLYYFKKRKH